MNNLTIRKYNLSDCKENTQLFYDTVHSVNAKDYTKDQLDAWTSGSTDLDKWNDSLSAHDTYVAVKNGMIAGFGDIDKTGYLDRLFVHKEHQREGIAATLCDQLEQAVNADKITTHVSITAKLFFEKRGYKTLKEQ